MTVDAAQPDQLDAMRRAPAEFEAPTRWHRGRCPRRGRPPRRPRRCGPTDGRAPGSRRRARPPASVAEAHPGGPSRTRHRPLGRRRPPRSRSAASSRRVRRSIRSTIGSSAFRTAVPDDGSASSSSPLARSIASSEPIRDRCTAWTAVTTPIDGRAIAARSAISPDTYMPISSTAASSSGPSRSSVSGNPISLFWLPSVLSVRRAAPRTVATASFVEVFAMLPVIPTTSGSNRRRQPAATAPRAARPSATRTIETSPNARTRRPAASRAGRRRRGATASSRWRWPSVRSPGSATNSCPGSTRRESTAAPRIGRSDRASSRPPRQADEIIGDERGRRVGRRPPRRVDVAHSGECPIASVTGPSRGSGRRRCGAGAGRAS